MKRTIRGKAFLLILLFMTCILAVSLVYPARLIAQPAFLIDPDKTPNDGGLRVLAVFGLTYAIRKLKKRE